MPAGDRGQHSRDAHLAAQVGDAAAELQPATTEAAEVHVAQIAGEALVGDLVRSRHSVQILPVGADEIA